MSGVYPNKRHDDIQGDICPFYLVFCFHKTSTKCS
jgi:hypothetical protein